MTLTRILVQLVGLIGFLFTLAASASEPHPVPFRRSECADRSSDRFFFPEGLLGGTSAQLDLDQNLRRWYSTVLGAMSEPSLSCDPPRGATYRFLLLRSFDTPIFVRVEAQKDGAILWAGVMGYMDKADKVVRSVRRNLSQAEWSQVTRGLDAVGFWNLPTWVINYGRDGERWIIEGRDGSRYHVVDRWSPRAGPYRDIGLALLKLAGLDTTFGKDHY
jgi:hypothetical protein